MTDAAITTKYHVPNRRAAERFEAKGKHCRAESDLGQRAPKVLKWEGHPRADLIGVRILRSELRAVWSSQMPSIVDRRADAWDTRPVRLQFRAAEAR